MQGKDSCGPREDPASGRPLGGTAPASPTAALAGGGSFTASARVAFEDVGKQKHAENALRFLAAAGAALASSLDTAATLASVAQLAVPFLADWCVVDVLQEDGSVRRVAAAHADPAGRALVAALTEYPPDPAGVAGVAAVLRSGQALVAPEAAVTEACAARCAEHLGILGELGMASVMVVPMRARGRTLGAITLVYSDSGRRYGNASLQLAEELAGRAGVAVDNARLYTQAQSARADLERRVAERTAQLDAANRDLEAQVAERQRMEQGQRLLAEAGSTLASSLDYETTLASVARMAVPVLADWCMVYTGDDNGQIRRLEVACACAEDEPLAARLARCEHPELTRLDPAMNVRLTGRSVLLADVPAGLPELLGRDEEHRQVIREMSVRSVMTVPLQARGRNVGALLFLSTRSGRRYDAEDLALAEELGRRAALAVDNARLHREAQGARMRQGEALALLETLLSGAPVGLAFLDADLRLNRVNDALAAMVHLSPDACAGRPIGQVLPAMASGVAPLLRQVLESGEPVVDVELDTVVAGHGGELRNYHVSCYPVGTDCGRVLGVGMVVADNTRRKRTAVATRRRLAVEEAVSRASRRLLSSETADLNEVLKTLGEAVSANRAYIFRFRDGGRRMDNTHEWCSPGTSAEMGNLQDLDAETMPWAMRKLRDHKPLVIPDVSELTAEAAVERAILQAQGIRSVVLFPMYGKNDLIGFVGFDDTVKCRSWTPDDVRFLRIIADVLVAYFERRDAEDALRYSEQRWRALVENAPDIIAHISPDGHYRYVSPAAFRMSGLSRDEIMSRNMVEFFHPDDITRVMGDLGRLLESPGAVATSEVRMRRKDGSWCHLEATASNRMHDPAVRGVIINSRDISDRKRAESALRLLAEASSVLACSLEYDATLAAVCRLAVPAMADWCVAYALDEHGTMRRVQVAHADPAATALAARWMESGLPQIGRLGDGVNVVQTGRPALLPEIGQEQIDRAAEDDAHLAVLRDVGARSGMVVPLQVRGQCVGVLLFISTGADRRYDAADLGLAEELGRRAALALENARLYQETRDAQRRTGESLERERRIAERFQSALLPRPDARIRGYTVAHAYRPALLEADVGGDFANVFAIDDRRMGLVMGDVGGKGLEAAVIGARVQQSIVALAVNGRRSPGAVLDEVRGVISAEEREELVTVFFAILERRTGRLQYAGAGHEPALLWDSRRGVVRELRSTGTAMCWVATGAYETGETHVESGDMLLLFTDGLPDARPGRSPAIFGTDRIEHLLAENHGQSPNVLIERLYQAAVSHSQGQLRDDIAVLALRRERT